MNAKIFSTLVGMVSGALNQYSYCGSFTYFDGQSFQVQIEKKQTPFTPTKLNTVPTGVFTYQPNSYDWIIRTENSKSICSDDKNILLRKIAGHLSVQIFLWIRMIN